jgi:1-phosphofructokinase family hexose kinase
VLVVGANLAQDRILCLPELLPGAVLRATDVTVVPGGKPVNVARVALALGCRPTLVANLPGRLGAQAANGLRDVGVEVVGVPTGGELRTATIVTEASGRVTVVNEPGAELSAKDAAALLATYVDALAARAPRVVVLSGSLPPGAPATMYAEMVAAAHQRGSTVVVDAGGAPLLHAIESGADLVKPNLAEAEGALRAPAATADVTIRHELVDEAAPDVPTRCRAAAAALVARGARAALVSGGRRGVALHDGDRSWWWRAPAVDVRNAVGAGDALVAGFAVLTERGAQLPAAVRYGMAVAAESVRHDAPGEVAVDAIPEVLATVPDPDPEKAPQ